jgi:uncharacterized protein (DUF433 family)
MTYDEIVWTDPERMSGTPCFRGTRVPIKSLFDHLEAGYTIDYFVYQFPTVKREQAIALLESVSAQAQERAVAEAKG